MLDKAKSLLQPSLRSAVPPFMVMDVMAAAARLEAQGRRIIHMEVGQPAAAAPATAIAAARAALSSGALGYTETLGIASLRRRIARAYRDWHGLEIDPQRIVVTTGSSAGFILAFLAAFEPGDRVAMALPGYPPYRHILTALGCEPVGIETTAQTRWSITSENLLAQHRVRPLSGVVVGSPANPTGTMMSATALAELIRCAEDAGIAVISDEIYHGLDYAFSAESAARISLRRHHHQFFLQVFLHDRMADRLDGGPAGAGARGRAAAAEPCDFGPYAVANCRRGGFRRPRRAGRGQTRLPGQPPHPARGLAGRRACFVSACRRRVLSLRRRVALLGRQFRLRQPHAGGGGGGGHAGHRFRSAARQQFCAPVLRRLAPGTSPRRSSGLARGSRDKQR